ncbi:protein phosphatase 2C 37-like [Olea europaea var. sylvestris]|uniref:protein-serine/threonine phosphatase n=1 Tax=Olea europaea subsp. europaea TaxID=158383 RepID=A0A8S0QJN1_OLEEU|nr:protein phosphatase 2C 37-like [Olea europaea var. sylvestris]CAA2967703.1 phosphatase 2C 37-like [Olea europaea subsp. europaea]
MAGMCCEVNIGETETTVPGDRSSKSGRRKTEIHQLKFLRTDSSADPPLENVKNKRQKIKVTVPVSPPCECINAIQNLQVKEKQLETVTELNRVLEWPKFGVTSVCGRRREMEDAVAIHPCFCGKINDISTGLHFFGVYDGHGCSHVATKCKERMHEIVKDELKSGEDPSWNEIMFKSFIKMDKEVTEWSTNGAPTSTCRCELQTPHCDAVGSTAVVAAVTPDKIIVSNCGDSRAVLCRNGVAIPLSTDHKPDRPDELDRINQAGGRVIFWDGPRVLGVLAMSRAIGDNYLKPYVIPEPDVTITERTADDECLILASDGLWDVVTNEVACGVARMCLRSRKPSYPSQSPGNETTVTAAGESSDKACSDASILLTKLALARHSSDNVSVVVVDLRKEL